MLDVETIMSVEVAVFRLRRNRRPSPRTSLRTALNTLVSYSRRRLFPFQRCTVAPAA